MKSLALLAGLVLAVTAVAQSAKTLNLAWDANDPADGVVAYAFKERIGQIYVAVVMVPGTQTTARITNVSDDVAHYYVVTAINVLGESKISNEVMVPVIPDGPPPATLPSRPENLRGSVTFP